MDVGRVELRKMSCNSQPTEVLKFSDWDRLQKMLNWKMLTRAGLLKESRTFLQDVVWF